MSVQKIINGWSNLIIRKQAIEELAKERLAICNVCEFKEQMMKVDVCGKCHCPIQAKTRSKDSRCPIDKWLPAIIKE